MLWLSRSAIENPRKWLVGLAFVTVVLALGLPSLEIRTDGAAIYPTGNEAIERTREDRAAFNDAEQIILLVSAKPGGPRVESPEGFRRLRRIENDLEKLPEVRPDEIRSLASLPEISAGTGSLSIGTYLDTIPSNQASFSALVQRIRAHPLVSGVFLSRDGLHAAFYIPLSGQVDRSTAIGNLNQWIARQNSGDFELSLLGPAVAEVTLGQMVLNDLRMLIPIIVVTIAIVLLLTLRNAGGVFIPLIEVVVVLIWVFGAMAYIGIPITLVTTILPVVLMAMAIVDEIHLLERIQLHFGVTATGEPPKRSSPEMRAVIAAAIADVGTPIIWTSLTTAIGLLSFLSASMAPLRHFGLFAAAGILAAMVMSFTLIPALAVLVPPRWLAPRRQSRRSTGVRLVTNQRMSAGVRGRIVLLVTLVILAISVVGITHLHVQDSWIGNFDRNSDLVRAERTFNSAFWGSYVFDVTFAGSPGTFRQPPGVSLVKGVAQAARAGPHVGGVMTFLDPLRAIARPLAGDRALTALTGGELADLLTLAQMRADRSGLGPFLTDNGAETRVRIVVNSPSYQRAVSLSRFLDDTIGTYTQGRDITYHYSGDLPVAIAVVKAIVGNQIRSLAWTLCGITVLMLLVYPRGLPALICMIPVTAATLLLLGGMGLAGMPLGIATSMFSGLIIGVGVDFALHFHHRFAKLRAEGLDPGSAVAQTVANSGRAIRWNAIVLAIGFSVLMFSGLRPNRSLGILLVAAIILCYGTTLLFLPVLFRRRS
jgi:predicted RND superfamily exporter protein